MRCDVESCIHNEDGYCMNVPYITINRNGECDSLEYPHIDLGLKKKKEEE